MVQNTERLCQCGFNAEYITDYAFQCFSDSDQQVTFRARLHGTAHATSIQLIEGIQQWVNTEIPVAVQGVRVNIDTCPAAITSFGDPQCLDETTQSTSGTTQSTASMLPTSMETVSDSITTEGQSTSQSDPCTFSQTTPEMPPTSMEMTSDSTTTATALLGTTDNNAAIVGGVVAVIVVLILAMTCIVIAVLVTKNSTYKYCTDQAVG